MASRFSATEGISVNGVGSFRRLHVRERTSGIRRVVRALPSGDEMAEVHGATVALARAVT
ncbi:MAG TPA: hypothetical protein VHE61_01210 [Opitutaceae bacterium]|nr:hypothetical protein [Opitutaceae bacterium]